jgi:tetratricopeptide (TPR) repeat protein
VGGGVGGETADVSPHAATVPLTTEQGRATDGLAPDEERAAPQTSRVSLAEMERLLRAQDSALPQPDPEATLVSNTSAATRPEFKPEEFDEELTISVPRSAQTRETGDFETTTDLESTQLADLEATRPASSIRSSQTHVTHNANADGASAEQATPVGTWPYDGPAADGSADADAPVGGASAPDATGSAAGVASGAASSSAGGAHSARPRRAWPLVVALCAAVAVVAGGGAWLAFQLLRRPAVTHVPTQPAAPPVTDAARQAFDQKLADAEASLAAGDIDGALARLREANALDPANWRAHRRLGDLLFESGARREAIEEYRIATRNAPEDFEAWRRLAFMQQEEGLDRDAVESFRRFIALTGGESAADSHTLFMYAGALERSGLPDEARALYQRLASSSDPQVSGQAQRLLDAMTRAQPTPAPTHSANAQPSPTPGVETASVTQPVATPVAAQPPPTPPPPTPTPAPPAPASPAERYGRGVQLWSSNRGAALEEFRAAASGGNLDAHYYLGLAYVEGRSPGSLNRAALVAALQHFQLAQRGGQHASQARGYAQQLEKEFDRLRRQ